MTQSHGIGPEATAAQSPAVAKTEGGPVTLVDLDALKSAAESTRKQNQDLERETQSLRTLSESLWVQRGNLLLPTGAQWLPPSAAELISRARSLNDQLNAIDNRFAELQEETHGAIGGLVAKATGWNQRHKLATERAQLSDQLRPLLVQIAHEARPVTTPNADLIGSQARAAEAQEQEVASRAADLATSYSNLSEELQRRTDAMREMGFDSLYTAAYLDTYGPSAVESPLVLKRGEQAYVSVAATLARQLTRRQWVGGSQGFSFPIGHTGIRYRVGSFHGHPVEQQFLAKLDIGSLIVTNMRVAFIGATKSSSVPLSKLLHIQCYSDGLATFQEGRENPDFYLTPQPKYVLFFINWFLNQGLPHPV